MSLNTKTARRIIREHLSKRGGQFMSRQHVERELSELCPWTDRAMVKEFMAAVVAESRKLFPSQEYEPGQMLLVGDVNDDNRIGSE